MCTIYVSVLCSWRVPIVLTVCQSLKRDAFQIFYDCILWFNEIYAALVMYSAVFQKPCIFPY